MTTLAVTSVNSLRCHASTCLRMGSKFRCMRSTPTEMQSISENDFECLASTGVKSPANAMFEQTNTRYPQVIAKRMLLSCELRRPMEKRHPSASDRCAAETPTLVFGYSFGRSQSRTEDSGRGGTTSLPDTAHPTCLRAEYRCPSWLPVRLGGSQFQSRSVGPVFFRANAQKPRHLLRTDRAQKTPGGRRGNFEDARLPRRAVGRIPISFFHVASLFTCRMS